jgi:uncharacterized membrane protein YvbJ
MKKELIDKLLNEQTTPEEEHLIAQELRQKEDIERWLIEDETALYDSIVAKRQAKRRNLRWAIAAVIVAIVISGATILWPQQVSETQVAKTTNAILNDKPNDTTKQQPLLSSTEIQQAVPQKAKVKAVKRRQTSVTDSLNYYIARLEKELENINESTYTTKADEVLRADARLQKLVQRIMIGELTKDNVPAEALNTNQTMEEQP